MKTFILVVIIVFFTKYIGDDELPSLFNWKNDESVMEEIDNYFVPSLHLFLKSIEDRLKDVAPDSLYYHQVIVSSVSELGLHGDPRLNFGLKLYSDGRELTLDQYWWLLQNACCSMNCGGFAELVAKVYDYLGISAITVNFIPLYALENRKGVDNSVTLSNKCSKKCLRFPSAASFIFVFLPDFTR